MSENKSVETLEERLGVQFTDRDLLQQVFVHRSYLNEHRSFPLGHNERLEFLGDAVLELIVTEHLYKTYPNPEGEMTAWRSSLVKGETLAEVARELGFPQYLVLSKGEEKSGGKDKGYLLANAFEAFIGALYLDQGYETCVRIISDVLLVRLQGIIDNKLFLDPKSRLQEYTQEHHGVTPQYEIVSEEGPDHAKQFTVAVMVGNDQVATGSGSSKQAAQVAAALEALIKYEVVGA